MITGGSQTEGVVNYFAPTLLADAKQEDIVQREVFGPVVSITVFDDEHQVLRWANDSHYGSGILRLDSGRRRAHRLSARLQYVAVPITTHFMLVTKCRMRAKQSGYGKDIHIVWSGRLHPVHIMVTLHHFTVQKIVVVREGVGGEGDLPPTCARLVS